MAPSGNVYKMKVGDRDRERGKEYGKKNAEIFTQYQSQRNQWPFIRIFFFDTCVYLVLLYPFLIDEQKTLLKRQVAPERKREQKNWHEVGGLREEEKGKTNINRKVVIGIRYDGWTGRIHPLTGLFFVCVHDKKSNLSFALSSENIDDSPGEPRVAACCRGSSTSDRR